MRILCQVLARPRTAAPLLLLLVLAGCGAPPAVTVVDLAAAVGGAEIQLEPVVIDCGTPSGRRYMIAGWSHDERHRSSGETFVWSEGDASELEFFLGWRRDLRLGGTRIDRVVQHTDIMPTLLDLAGIETSALGDGISLLASASKRRSARSYLDYWDKTGASMVTRRWKYIHPLSANFGEHAELFDRREDRGETTDLARQRPAIAGFLASLLRQWSGEKVTAPQTEIDESTRSELEALGYLR